MVSSGKNADENISSDKLQQKLSSISGITISRGTHDNTIHSSKQKGARSDLSIITKKELQDSDATVSTLQSDTKGSTCSLPHKKPLQSPKTVPRALQSGQNSPSIIREKVSKDGYNWRKYGQKNVKGNEYIRNYYKCTHPNCQAKKQLEQSNNGQITDTICIGDHNHPSPQLSNPIPVDAVMPVVEEKADNASLANAEGATIEHRCMTQQIKPHDCLSISTVAPNDEVEGVHLQLTKVKDEVHNYEDPESKRLKKENCNEDVSRVVKSTSESRVVVQTSSEVDFVNDGYRWRKYGQKLVKGNPNPRSYYRCSNPGCPVKKHVERSSHDPKIVMTTYEGQHDHDMPPGRTVTHNAGGNNHTAANNGKSETKSGVNPVSVDAGKLTCSAPESILKERLNEERSAEQETDEKIGSHVISRPSENPASKSSEQEHQNGNSDTKADSVRIDVKGHSSSKVPCQSNEQMKGEVKPEESKDDCLHVAVQDAPNPDDKSNIQSNSDEKPVKS